MKVFTIHENNGSIIVQDDSTDAETVNEYTLIVEAQDRRYDPIRYVHQLCVLLILVSIFGIN